MTCSIHFRIERVALVLVLLTVTVSCQDVLKCMSCRKASHFTHCEEMVKCDPEIEVCYVEEEIDFGGETVVNAGCRRKEYCDAVGCFGENVHRKKRSSDSGNGVNATGPEDSFRDVICHHCCDGDFCNMYGCPDSFDVSHLPGSRCFVCESVLQPEYCNTIKNCEAGYTCGIEKTTFGVDDRYTLECIRKQKCEILKMIHQQNNYASRKKRSVQLWADCCDSHLCNGYLPLREAPPSITSKSYKCPQGTYGAFPDFSATTKGTTTVPTTTEPVCEDLDPDCDAYGTEYLCMGTYAEWARQHCAKYCGFCGTPQPSTAPTTTVKKVCEDVDSDCDVYGVDYICFGDYEDWARDHCAKYCGFCGTSWTAEYERSNRQVHSGQGSFDISTLQCSLFILISYNIYSRI